ncbi:MAG: hypothetical protein ACYDCU_04220 [Candidatus Acidiferrales bacterium]
MMNQKIGHAVRQSLRKIMLAACVLFLVGAAYGQGSGPCAVSQIRVRIGTANGVNAMVGVLNIEIHFTNGTIQKAPDVNANMTWGVNSQNVVTIPLNQPVPVTEIKRIRLIYNISAGEWDMSFLRARAIGSVWNGRIAAWGSDPNPSPHRFTATYPAFGVDTAIPANACNLARVPVAGPVRLAPGAAVESHGPLMNQNVQNRAVLVSPMRTTLLQQQSQGTNIGTSQTLSATGTAPSGAASSAATRPMLAAPAAMQSGNSGGGGGSGLNPAVYPGGSGLPSATGGSGQGENSGTCDVTQIRLRIGTGGDDLRGGQDNLNIIIYFTGAKPQVALNVNSNANWPNNSTHMVVIPLKPPVAPSEVRAIRLFHVADGSFDVQSLASALTPAAPIEIAKAIQSPDNWDMSGLQASALGNGVGLRIASVGFHRFTGSNPDLTIYVAPKVMAKACGTGRPTGNSGGGTGGGAGPGLNPELNPGGPGLHPVTDATGPGGVGGASGALITNSDVQRMVRTGVPESAIIGSIRTNPVKLDLSLNALFALHRAGVRESILLAMIKRGNGPRNETKTAAVGITGGGRNGNELNPQPYPPKGTLLVPGSQKMMLGTQANPLPGDGGNAAAVPKQTTVPRTSPGVIGPSQTMSSTTNSASPTTVVPQAEATAMAPRSGSPLAAMEHASSQAIPTSEWVSLQCAKDPSFRVLGVSGAPDGTTLTVGPQYTIWGCSFGAPALVKAPKPVNLQQPLATQAQVGQYSVTIYTAPFNIAWFVDADIKSWSDNAIVVTVRPAAAVYPGGSLAGSDLRAVLWIVRGDGQLRLYGVDGGLMFKPAN